MKCIPDNEMGLQESPSPIVTMTLTIETLYNALKLNFELLRKNLWEVSLLSLIVKVMMGE